MAMSEANNQSDAKEIAKQASIARVMDGRSWDDFCDALKKAGHDIVLAPTAPANPLEKKKRNTEKVIT